MKKIIFSLISLNLLLNATNTWANDTFYKWVDQNGSTHYTLTPPPKNAKSLGKMKTYRDFSYPITQIQQEHNNPSQSSQPSQYSNESPQSKPSITSQMPTQSAPNTVPQQPNTQKPAKQGQFIPLPK